MDHLPQPSLMRLPDSFLEELRARTPLAALIGRRVKLVRSGRQWKACCPFHGEKSPSFYIYDDGYHCFGCGAHGDAISFVMQSQGASFMDAVEMLAGEAGLEIPKPSAAAAQAEQQRLDLHGILAAAAAYYQRALFTPGGAAALAYLRRRGLSDETIARFGLGWAGEGRGALAQALAVADVTPHRLMEAGLLRPGEDDAPRGELFFNRVMFPIRDRRGRVISFGGRTMGDGQPKYVNGPETAVFSKRRTLYALDLAKSVAATKGEQARQPPQALKIVAVEGYMDVIALHQAGFTGAVAPLGTALTEDQLELLWQMSPAPVLCFDGDAAGARAAARAAEVALPKLAPDKTILIATLPGGEDPDTLIKAHGADRFAAILAAAKPLSEALFDIVHRRVGTLTAKSTPEQRRAVEAELEKVSALVGDRALAYEYKRDLRARYRALIAGFYPSRGGTRQVARSLTDRPVASLQGTALERVRTLTAIVLRHPSLGHRLEDALSHLTLPAASERLIHATLSYSEQVDHLDFADLIAHLTQLDLSDDIAWALGDVPCPSPAYAGASATASEAEAGWWHIYGLMRGSSLEAEVAAARERFNADPSAAAQQRLIALCSALDQWRRGGDETADEDQDFMSRTNTGQHPGAGMQDFSE
jgi:DNA primase